MRGENWGRNIPNETTCKATCNLFENIWCKVKNPKIIKTEVSKQSNFHRNISHSITMYFQSKFQNLQVISRDISPPIFTPVTDTKAPNPLHPPPVSSSFSAPLCTVHTQLIGRPDAVDGFAAARTFNTTVEFPPIRVLKISHFPAKDWCDCIIKLLASADNKMLW